MPVWERRALSAMRRAAAALSSSSVVSLSWVARSKRARLTGPSLMGPPPQALQINPPRSGLIQEGRSVGHAFPQETQL
jgi:hypothetical protein